MNPQKSIGFAFTDRHSGQVIEWGRQLPVLARSVGSSPCSDTSESRVKPTCETAGPTRLTQRGSRVCNAAVGIMFEVQRACRARPPSFFSPRLVMALMPANMGKNQRYLGSAQRMRAAKTWGPTHRRLSPPKVYCEGFYKGSNWSKVAWRNKLRIPGRNASVWLPNSSVAAASTVRRRPIRTDSIRARRMVSAIDVGGGYTRPAPH